MGNEVYSCLDNWVTLYTIYVYKLYDIYYNLRRRLNRSFDEDTFQRLSRWKIHFNSGEKSVTEFMVE